ncbi:hypothetical protein I2486_15490 [Cellulophaga sp. E16_2]|uniref:hypothetical protein n=1 Tax=Cellulophaga sp. E16_2 TaxID=2789297 RepID=UPI001A92AE84|nr:hypothetical protein [Cellulophaga sp. E16_2]MBO0592807.1 hypothetical protein [Cellulophaga sp. E16_2]
MLTKEINTIGLGSFFPTIAPKVLEASAKIEAIKNYELFYTGRHAIKHLLTLLQVRKKIRKIWLPNYYCPHVTSWLRANFNTIDTYAIEPFFAKLPINFDDFATEEDVVILNNFWGIYEYQIPENKNRAVYIEDHSHGWLSAPCLESKADYCFASLRKTLPIPLGGILWQPNGNEDLSVLNKTIKEDFSMVWDKINTAMTLKCHFNINETGTVNDYLKIIGETEDFLHHQYTVIPINEKHKEFILKYLGKEYNNVKSQNFEYILKKLVPKSEFAILDNKNTFGLELVFKDREAFNSLKQHLIHNKIYPSELWAENILETPYKYLLNIHIDFRYTTETMDYIAEKLNSWNS